MQFTFGPPSRNQGFRRFNKRVFSIDDPLSSTDDLSSLVVGHLEPVAVWCGGVLGPLSCGTFGDVGAFEDFPEVIEGYSVLVSGGYRATLGATESFGAPNAPAGPRS